MELKIKKLVEEIVDLKQNKVNKSTDTKYQVSDEADEMCTNFEQVPTSKIGKKFTFRMGKGKNKCLGRV